MKCFYNQRNHCVEQLTKEHVISNSVLKQLNKRESGSITQADVYNNKILFNHEQVIRDVCKKCNNISLSIYDNAGKELVINLINSTSNEPLNIPFTEAHLGWLLKSHFNFFRVIKNSLDNKPFKVQQRIKNALIKHKKIPTDSFIILARNLDNTPEVWGDVETKHSLPVLPQIHYNSKIILPQEIVISRLTIRQLDTVLILPSNGVYKKFEKRADDSMYILKDWGGGYCKLELNSIFNERRLKFKNIFGIDKLSPYIDRAFS